MINPKLKYKYALEALGLSIDCPVIDAIEKETYAYRYCFSDLNHPDTFLPQALKNPARRLTTEQLICDNYGLSLFTTAEEAKTRFGKFPERTRALLGYTHIAEGELFPTDGLCTPREDDGHFNLHEYAEVDLIQSFSIHSTL